MPGDLPLPQRYAIRLATYDYRRAGAYFVAICTLNRACLFGEVVGDEIQLSEGGRIAREEWLRSAEMRREVEIDAFVAMPNHVHEVVFIADIGGERDGEWI